TAEAREVAVHPPGGCPFRAADVHDRVDGAEPEGHAHAEEPAILLALGRRLADRYAGQDKNAGGNARRPKERAPRTAPIRSGGAHGGPPASKQPPGPGNGARFSSEGS